jgi:hypothetical protein
LTLESIAKTTKIKASLLSALERNDLSQWPSGIFRRAFLRSYAKALGLPPEPILADFQRYFPEEGLPDPAPWVDEEPQPLPRLMLAHESDDGRVMRLRAASAGLELTLVLLLGALLAFVAGTGFWRTAGIVALLYYPSVTALTARTVQLRLPRLPAWMAMGRAAHSRAEKDIYTVGPPGVPPDAIAGAGTDAAGDEFRPPHTAVH